MNPDLVAFLNARLDEEQYEAVKFSDDPDWSEETMASLFDRLPSDSIIRHIAHYDPARVLREVTAKRVIKSTWEDCPGYDLPPGVHDGRDDTERSRDVATKDALEDVVRALASVWSDHPDYQQEWAP